MRGVFFIALRGMRGKLPFFLAGVPATPMQPRKPRKTGGITGDPKQGGYRREGKDFFPSGDPRGIGSQIEPSN